MQLTSLLLTKYQRTWADKLPRVPIAQTQPKRFLLQSAPLVLAWQFLSCWLNPGCPLGGTSFLFAFCRCLFGHFGRLLRANSYGYWLVATDQTAIKIHPTSSQTLMNNLG